MEKKNLYLGLGALAVVGLGAYLLFRNKGEKKSNVAGLPPAGAPVIPNPQTALSPTQMAQPQINPTASYQNIPPAPPAGGGGGAPPAGGGGEHHGGHHGDWNRFGWGGGFGYPVYIGSQYGYNQCLIRNANGTTAIVNCDNMDEVANVDLGVDGSNSNNISNFYYPSRARN